MPETKAELPKPVRSESRICFGLEWYATLEEAEQVAAYARSRGETYNGGYMHGAPCGRRPEFDGRSGYAVSRR